MIQSFIDCYTGLLEARGLRFDASVDMHEYAAFINSQTDQPHVSGPHDPGRVHLTPDNAYWTRIWDGDRIVACHAQRLIETENILQDILTERLYGTEGCCPLVKRHDLGLNEKAKRLAGISGRVGFGGGLVIQPEYRNPDHDKSLYHIYARLGRAVSLRWWDLDWYAAFFTDKPSRVSLGMKGAGFTNYVPLGSGTYPPYRRQLDTQFMWISAAECIEDMRECVRRTRTPETLHSA